MSPHGIKIGSKKAKGVSLTSNGPRVSKKKRKLVNENSDPDVLDRTSKYWHGLKIDASDDIKEKLLKHLSSPSRRYKLKNEGLVLPAKKKRKLQKNGSLETDSDDEKNSKKCKQQIKKKYEESPTSSKFRKWKSELASLGGTKSKSKKLLSVSGEMCGKGKKSSRQKLLSSNYEDFDGVCIYELGTTPELKNKAWKKKLLSEKSKGDNHLMNMNKKKVKVGKGMLTAPGLGKKKKSKLRVNEANLKVLSKKQQNKLQKKYSLQIISDGDDGGTDSDHTTEKSISTSSLKKNLAKLSQANWMDMNKKKLKKHLQEFEIPKSKKSKRRQVSDDDDEEEEDDEAEDNDEEYEEEEEESSSVEDVSDDLEDDDDDDDDNEDSSEDRTSDDKSGFVLGLSKLWIKRHDDKAVVILKHPFECQLLGTVKISVLSGSIKMLGARLCANGQWHNLYSPSSHMLLKLSTEYPTGNDVSQARAQLSAMFSDTDCYSNLINPTVVVLLVCDMNWGFSDYIATVCPYQRLFQAPPEAHKFSCNKILKPFGLSLFDTSMLIPSRTSTAIDKFFTKWSRILKDIDSPKILVCGDKNTGKSTFSRILINMALESRKAVCFLDCDPGQTEFTPPGCISLSVVKQFVLGPPFCHQQDPAFNIFFGEVSPNKNCNHYLMCVWSALQYYCSLPERLPLIVNSMGWVTGMGKNLLDGILNMLGPNHVVLLNSPINTCCPTDFSPETVMQNPWNFPGDSLNNPTTSSCSWELTVLESVVSPDIIKKSKLTAPELRNLSMLSYLGKNWSPGVSLNHNIPFKVKWTSLAIYVCQEFVPSNQILYAINASVVALCIADLNQAYHPNNDENFPMTFYKKPICKCVGFGFVRGIHAGSQMLYIVSPLPLSIILQVNTLLRGSIHLPLDKMQTLDVTDLKYVDKMLTKSMASQTNKKRRVLYKKH